MGRPGVWETKICEDPLEKDLIGKPTGSSHSVLVCVKYRNSCLIMDADLLFAILLGQIKSKLIDRLVTYGLASL